MKLFNYLAPLCALGLPFSAQAQPWIDTSDLLLRTNIQYLADAGLITTPVTTFPLMWQDIGADLKRVSSLHLTEQQQQAFDFVSYQFKLAQRNQKTLAMNAGTEHNRFTSFGDFYRGKNNLQVSTQFMTDAFAVNITSTYSPSTIDGDKLRFDGSYLATFVGNWVLAAGMQDRWWGPGWDSNLSLTNNARPMPTISLSRKSAEPLVLPFTDYGIPWTVTTFMGKMDDPRVINNTLLWGVRLNFKPIQNLEIGITRLAQWAGDDRPKNTSTFWNVLIGKDNCGNDGRAGLDCGVNNENEPGNQQAGYDLRYSFNINDIPFSFYGQYFAEDGSSKNNSSSILTEPQVQVGVDSHLTLLGKPTTVFLEYTDTFADCSDQNNIRNGNCYYEHHLYQTGMRYHQRTIGNLYDNDASTLVLGFISAIDTNTNMTIKLRKLALNKDNLDKAPDNPLIGNPLTKIAEDLLMFSIKVQHSYQNWRYTLGTDLSQSSYINDISSKNKVNLSFNLEYNI